MTTCALKLKIASCFALGLFLRLWVWPCTACYPIHGCRGPLYSQSRIPVIYKALVISFQMPTTLDKCVVVSSPNSFSITHSFYWSSTLSTKSLVNSFCLPVSGNSITITVYTSIHNLGMRSDSSLHLRLASCHLLNSLYSSVAVCPKSVSSFWILFAITLVPLVPFIPHAYYLAWSF